jgi:hypothetical protein
VMETVVEQLLRMEMMLWEIVKESEYAKETV